jgi:hypothetical protein
VFKNEPTHTCNTEMCVEHVDYIPGSIGNTTALRILKLRITIEQRAHGLQVWNLESYITPTWADKMKEDSFSALIDETLFKIDRAESTQKL